MIRRTLVSVDFYVATGLVFALFLGNAKFGGLPLILLFSLFSLVFIPLYRPHIYKDISTLIAATIFLIYSIRANITYDETYSYWVLSFILGYFYTTLVNSRILFAPHIFYVMAFRAAFIALVIFFVGSMINFYLSIDTRSEFIFGPNMLYRVYACLGGLVAGYLFLNGKKFSGLIVAIISLILLILTGSRAALITLIMLVLIWTHAHAKIISIKKNIPVVIFFIVFAVILITQIDINNIRVFGFAQFTLDENSRYLDAYVRWRPYLYFIFEPNSFSLIGANHQVFMSLFGQDLYLYPHNIFLELVIYYGLFGIFVSVYTFIKLYKLLKYMVNTFCTRAHILYYSILVSGIGTLFSGDMGDNGVFLGILIAMSSKILESQEIRNNVD